MSIWTHVNGSIRVDAIRAREATKRDALKHFEKILGKVATYENFVETSLPCGSEGSLQWSLWISPNPSSMAAFTINIFGDLRDYTDIDAIRSWFFRTLMTLQPIRDAILKVGVEGGERRIFYFDVENNSLVDIAIPIVHNLSSRDSILQHLSQKEKK